jgi:acyl-CoA reductase-like NAD-dependent aldehyde dehydrogenase
VPLRKRLDAIARFRERIVAMQETLARTLTKEVGKPIRQSRNELNGLLARLDFFLGASARVLRDEKVYADAAPKLEERITHEPLGVVANISAWNYPYFVGSNVFVPALVAGNAVLYKPSEFATLTGLHIAEMLHEAGVPRDAFVPVVGDGATGAALLRQPVDGVFFTGSYATGAKIAATAGRRMIKAQLELGGRTPSMSARTSTSRRPPPASPTARSTTPDSRAARSSGSTCTKRSTTPSSPRSSPR